MANNIDEEHIDSDTNTENNTNSSPKTSKIQIVCDNFAIYYKEIGFEYDRLFSKFCTERHINDDLLTLYFIPNQSLFNKDALIEFDEDFPFLFQPSDNHDRKKKILTMIEGFLNDKTDGSTEGSKEIIARSLHNLRRRGNVDIHDFLYGDTSFGLPIFSQTLMNGYLRRQKLNEKIPTEINEIIIKYFNFLWLKIRYDIDDESDKCEHLMRLNKNMSFRELSLNIERDCKYQFIEDNSDMSLPYFEKEYPTYIRLWLKFFALKKIYPVDRRITVTMADVEKDLEQNRDRWVEIPGDVDSRWISELLQFIENKKYILEMAVEKYDWEQRKWPFPQQYRKFVRERVPIVHSGHGHGHSSESDSDSNVSKEGSVLQKRCMCECECKYGKWKTYLKIGDIIEVKDKQEQWYESVVRNVERDSESGDNIITIHYIGWSDKWDAKLIAYAGNRSIATRGTHTRSHHKIRQVAHEW